MTSTIVTAYYPLQKAKHSITEYREWIENFCQIPKPMVIFTTSELVPLFQELRKDYERSTCVIARELNQFQLCSEEAMERLWKPQWEQDPEQSIHSPELYAVWSIKSECVTIASRVVKSDWYVWCDIGIQRNRALQSYYQTFTDSISVVCASDRINFLEVKQIPDEIFAISETKQSGSGGEICYRMPYPPPQNSLGGGCIVGTTAVWNKFHFEYLRMIEEFTKRNWFCGKDQTIFLALLLEKKCGFRLFFPSSFAEGAGDLWMSFPVILGGQVPVCIDARCEPSKQASAELSLLMPPPKEKEQETCIIELRGGLGNQLFEIATAFAHCRRTGKHLVLPPTTCCTRPTYWKSFLHKCAPLVVPDLQTYLSKTKATAVLWREPHFHYQTIPSYANRLVGYFQSSQYFSDVSNEIRELFEPHSIIQIVVTQKYKELLNSDTVQDTWIIHVRRTDYLSPSNSSKHAVCDKAWYSRAIETATRNGLLSTAKRILIFSDDLEWCRNEEQKDLWISTGCSDICFVNEPNDVLALHLMSQFNRFIIPNSTFSWWAVWLGHTQTTNKIVIVPNRWFGPKGPQDWEDIYEPGWIRVD